MDERANESAATPAAAPSTAARERALAVGNLESPPPAVPTGEAVRLAGDLFGISVETADRLPGERDRNFLLTATDGSRFVMKVVHPAEDPVVSELQARLLDHLATKRIPAQTVIAPGAGREPVLTLAGPPQIRCRVRCVTYLPGRPLEAVGPSRSRWLELGRFLGRLDLALSDFDEPEADRPFLWDVKRAEQLRPLVDHIRDSLRRRRVAAILDAFADDVRPRLPAMRSQVIHNDANPQNVLVAAEQPERISGLIDFGDAVQAPLVQELAVAIAYQSLAEPSPFCAALDITRGYHEVSSLTSEELALIPSLVATRLALTTVITSWRSALHPENAAYIMRNDTTIEANLALITDLCRETETTRFVTTVLDATPQQGSVA